jgi:hypothetical protein
MTRIVGGLALLLVLLTGLLTVAIWGFPKTEYAPVLTLELPSNAGELDSLLHIQKAGSPNFDAKKVFHCDTVIDCFFIPTYTFFLMAFVWMMRGGIEGRPANLVPVAMLTALAAGIADGFENRGIFAALAATSIDEATAAAIRNPSQVKWVLLFNTFLLIGIMMLRWTTTPFHRGLNFVLATAMATSAIFGFCGLLFWRGAITIGMGIFGILPLVSLWLLKQKES